MSATPAATELVTATVSADIRPGSPKSWAELWNDAPHDPSEQARFAQFIDLADDDNKAARWLLASGK